MEIILITESELTQTIGQIMEGGQTLISVLIASAVIPYLTYIFKSYKDDRKNIVIAYNSIVHSLNQLIDTRNALKKGIDVLLEISNSNLKNKTHYNPTLLNVPVEGIKIDNLSLMRLIVKDLVIINRMLNIVRLINGLNKNINVLKDEMDVNNELTKQNIDILNQMNVPARKSNLEEYIKNYSDKINNIIKNAKTTLASTDALLEQTVDFKIYVESSLNRSWLKKLFSFKKDIDNINHIGEKNQKISGKIFWSRKKRKRKKYSMK